MISVAKALDQLSDLVRPLQTEVIPLKHAQGRIMVEPAVAQRDQPPFSASAMDGYAIGAADLNTGMTQWTVIGESAAGHRYTGHVAPGQAVRIFTGAPLPGGTDHVVIQENVTRTDDMITLCDTQNTKSYVRARGADFAVGYTVPAPTPLTPNTIALLAAMNIAEVTVSRRPRVAILATGDELVQPGEVPNEDQIIASNSYGLFAMLQNIGADPRLLPIARDRLTSLHTVFDLAQGADLIVTIGGASVGDHDLVARAAQDMGLQQQFYKVAMRPGKPLMAGTLNGVPMIGLPGNPVSAMVCGEIFLTPMVQKMLGLPFRARSQMSAPLAHDLPTNGPREHYMRAALIGGKIQSKYSQDSALLTVLQGANILMVRPPHDPARASGQQMTYIPL